MVREERAAFSCGMCCDVPENFSCLECGEFFQFFPQCCGFYRKNGD
jgi:hypothetical protein